MKARNIGSFFSLNNNKGLLTMLQISLHSIRHQAGCDSVQIIMDADGTIRVLGFDKD